MTADMVFLIKGGGSLAAGLEGRLIFSREWVGVCKLFYWWVQKNFVRKTGRVFERILNVSKFGLGTQTDNKC